MNKIGIHAMVWSGTWGAEESERAIASTREAGYDLIELPAFSPESMDLDAISRALEAHELEATCSLGLGFHNDINSEDSESVARGEQTLSDALSMCRDVGSRYMGGVIFSALSPYLEMPTARGRENSQAVIGRLGGTGGN